MRGNKTTVTHFVRRNSNSGVKDSSSLALDSKNVNNTNRKVEDPFEDEYEEDDVALSQKVDSK